MSNRSNPSFHLSREEADELIRCFTKHHNLDSLALVLRHLREDLQVDDVAPKHYHALLRVFSFQREQEHVRQAFLAMSEKGLAGQATFARVVDCLHSSASSDALVRIVGVVSAVLEHHGALRCPSGAEDEPLGGGAAAAMGRSLASSLDGGEAVADSSSSLPSSSSSSTSVPMSSSNGTTTMWAAPVLTSLLHHLTHDERYSPLLPLLVSLWIEALGVRLSEWDVLHCLTAVLTKSAQFQTVRQLIGSFAGAARHVVTPEAVLDRLFQQGAPFLIAAGAPAPLSDGVKELEAVMRRSLMQSGVLAKPVETLFWNGQYTTATDLVDETLERSVLRTAALGPGQHNAAPLYHAVMLLYSTLRDDTSALHMLPKLLETSRRYHDTYPAAYFAAYVAELQHAEPFAIHAHMLMDAGLISVRTSLPTQFEIAPTFLQLATQVASHSSDQDNAYCAAYTIPTTKTNADAAKIWAQIEDLVRSGEGSKLPHTVKVMIKQFVELCSRHPLPNSKLTAKGLAEREKWGLYLEARDTSLALFGSGKQAREMMRRMFYEKGEQHALRSLDMVASDVKESCALFNLPAASSEKYQRFVQEAQRSAQSGVLGLIPNRDRLLASVTRCEPYTCPRHLYDPAVPNPFPLIRLKRSPLASEAVPQLTEDFFPLVWTALMSPTSAMGNGNWHLKDPEMLLLLLRCVVHRLDWEAASQLVLMAIPAHCELTFLMDHEISQMFWEIGDPAGGLAFKTATKLYDGRIAEEGEKGRREATQRKLRGGEEEGL